VGFASAFEDDFQLLIMIKLQPNILVKVSATANASKPSICDWFVITLSTHNTGYVSTA
jgi:hypothetical protein